MKTIAKLILLPLLALAAGQACAAKQDLQVVRRQVDSWLANALASSPGTPSYTIRQIDERLSLDSCNAMDITLPPGYRLVGNTMLRVRCADGASWSINVPVQISIMTTYVMATRPLAANHAVSDADIALQQGDLAALPGSVLLDPAQAIGRTLTTAIGAGQPIRREQLRAAIVIQQNQRVRVLFKEDGMEIANEGIAMTSAAEGAPVRVRVSNNQIVSGIARGNGTVEVSQ